MSARLFYLPKARQFTTSGQPMAGAKLTFYRSGTYTPVTVYADAALLVPLAQPVAADSIGSFVPIFMDTSINYRIELKSSADALVSGYPVDDFRFDLDAQDVGRAFWPRSNAEISAVVTPTNYAFKWGDPRRYGAAGDGSTADQTAIQTADSAGGVLIEGAAYYSGANITFNNVATFGAGGSLFFAVARTLTFNKTPVGVSPGSVSGAALTVVYRCPSVALGTRTTGVVETITGTAAVAIGSALSAQGNNSVAIGQAASARAQGAVAEGNSATVYGIEGVAIGRSAISGANIVSTTLTANATPGTYGLTVASITSFANAQSIQVLLNSGRFHDTTINGVPSGSTITLLTPIPANELANSGNAVNAVRAYGAAVGSGAQASGTASAAFGQAAVASATTSLALGYQAAASATYGIAIGAATVASGAQSIALGTLSSATGANTQVFGNSITCSVASAWFLGTPGYKGIFGIGTTAVADGDLPNNALGIWADATHVFFKRKDNAGTVTNGSVTMS